MIIRLLPSSYRKEEESVRWYKGFVVSNCIGLDILVIRGGPVAFRKSEEVEQNQRPVTWANIPSFLDTSSLTDGSILCGDKDSQIRKLLLCA